MIITDDKDKIIKAYKKEQVEYTNKFIDMQEEIERLKKENKELEEIIDIRECQLEDMQQQKTDYTQVNILEMKLDKLHSIIKEVREYIKENQEEHKYTDRGGFTYTEGHFLRDSDTLLEILDKEYIDGKEND